MTAFEIRAAIPADPEAVAFYDTLAWPDDNMVSVFPTNVRLHGILSLRASPPK
jgi:hypothetical protein